MNRRRVLGVVCGLALIGAGPAAAQARGAAEDALLRLLNANVSEQATGALALLGITLVPSETASTLVFEDVRGDSRYRAAQLGGAFTVSEALPLYLEGYAGWSRYDPTFVLTDGARTSLLPAKWTSFGATGGVGWDFALSEEWVLRPIANVSLGHVESDASLVGRLLDARYGLDIEFLEDGRLTAGGAGASLMLDFERVREAYEMDVEIRYTHIHLEPIAGSRAIDASSEAATLGLWSRVRTPTPFRIASGPLRVVTEFSASWLPGDQGATLGEDVLGQFGLGLEIDVEDAVPLATRGRMVGRVTLGERLRGFSVGLAVSF
jgi:hypothetical protein